jgi:NAD(P)H-hydrate epimerase
MKIHLSRNQVREVDRWAIEDIGIPGAVLMENAARNAVDVLWLKYFETGLAERAVIVCGPGNNGGDGFAIARHLVNRRAVIRVVLCGNADQLTGDALLNYNIDRAMGINIENIINVADAEELGMSIHEKDVLIDALLGTGFKGPVRSPTAEVIEQINHSSNAAVIAIDVPSGLDCDSGMIENVAVRADLTVTFIASKQGFEHAKQYVGKVVVADIGIIPKTWP